MPRRKRIMLAGLPVHIVQRGNNRNACFFADDDRRFYLHHLARLLPQSQCALHAYCLMTNHVHLLLTPRREDGCATLMRRLDLLHSQYMNRKYARTGSLWEGRFRSCIVQTEQYLMRCYRYIEANPVRAGLVQSPDRFEWSSFAANGGGLPSALITPHEEYLRLGESPQLRCTAYRELFGSAEDATLAIREATNANLVLGDPSFLQRLAASLGRRVARGRAGRPAARPPGSGPPDLLQKKVVRP